MLNEGELLIIELNAALQEASYDWEVLAIDGDNFILNKPDPSGVIAIHLKMTRMRLNGEPHPLPNRKWFDWDDCD